MRIGRAAVATLSDNSAMLISEIGRSSSHTTSSTHAHAHARAQYFKSVMVALVSLLTSFWPGSDQRSEMASTLKLGGDRALHPSEASVE